MKLFGSPPPPAPSAPAAGQGEMTLADERDRLIERFAVMQSELGGLFYEMAIRDHVRMDLLLPRAAALQRVEAELAEVELQLANGETAMGGRCPSCQGPYARGAAFCSSCGTPLPG